MAAIAAGLSGNQWNAIPLTTASYAPSGTGISWTPARISSTSAPRPASFSRNWSSIPSEGVDARHPARSEPGDHRLRGEAGAAADVEHARSRRPGWR